MFVTLLLAYFLTPEAYGLVAMMSVFLALGSSIMQSGFNQALIRMPEVTQTDYNTAFFANIGLGIFAYLLLFLSAPLISAFYEQPELISLIRVAALSIVINSFQVVQQANLSRTLNFRAQVKAALPASTISGIAALVLAYFGSGVWALVWQMLITAVLQTALLWKVQGWRPTGDFSVPTLREMYTFGYKLFLSGVLDTIFQNLYALVIAKLFSATVAGFYYFANQIKQLVIQQLVTTVQTVTYPALSKLQHDEDALRRNYRRVLRLSVFIVFPAMFFLSVMAEPLFELFLPEKWYVSASYLELMCFASLLIPMNSINLNIIKIKGRSDLYLLLEVVKKVISLSVLLLSLKWGVLGILIGQIISSLIAYFPNSYFSQKLIGYSVVEQMQDVIFYFIVSASIALLGHFLFLKLSIPSIVMVTFVLPALVLVYALVCFKFKPDDIRFVFSLVRHRTQ